MFTMAYVRTLLVAGACIFAVSGAGAAGIQIVQFTSLSALVPAAELVVRAELKGMARRASPRRRTRLFLKSRMPFRGSAL